MLLTEEEAKTKWCVRSPIEPTLENAFAKTCEASDCMAWRWDAEGYEEAITAYEDAANIGGITHREVPVSRGYCGLAGKS